MADKFTTWVELMCWRSRHHPDRRALTFLQNSEKEESHLTYGELDRSARCVAAGLQSRGIAPGERVLMLYPSGLEFAAGFLGCLYAGVMAIPAPPPRMNRNLNLLRGITGDAEPVLSLTTTGLLTAFEPMAARAGLDTAHWTTHETVASAQADEWREPVVREDMLAFLQYTSGSTSRPKGVMVSHANLLNNHRMMQQAYQQSDHTALVTWLPLFHDFGLILHMLQALYIGGECVLMAPEAFLMKPVRWLQAISRYTGCQSGAPNFAYELCAQRVTAEQRSTLDLSQWETALVAAEPVRAQTLERFARVFASCGFRREAFNPGLRSGGGHCLCFQRL